MAENDGMEKIENQVGRLRCMYGEDVLRLDELRVRVMAVAEEIEAIAARQSELYREICRPLMEKQKAKEPIKDKNGLDCCPNCGWPVYYPDWGGTYVPHCENCGQRILWKEIYGIEEGGENIEESIHM